MELNTNVQSSSDFNSKSGNHSSSNILKIKNKNYLNPIHSVKIVNDRNTLNMIGLKARYNLVQINQQNKGTYKNHNMFEKLDIGKSKLMIDKDLENQARISKNEPMEKLIQEEVKRKNFLDEKLKGIKLVKSNPNEEKIFTKKLKRKESLPVFKKISKTTYVNFSHSKLGQNLGNISIETQNQNLNILQSPKKSSKEKAKMSFTSYELSPMKQHIFNSTDFKKSIKYGRLKKFRRKSLKNLKFSVKQQNKLNLAHKENSDDFEELSVGSKRALYKKNIVPFSHNNSKIRENLNYEESFSSLNSKAENENYNHKNPTEFKVKNRGYLPVNVVLSNDTNENMLRNPYDYNVQIVEKNNQFVYSLTSRKNLIQLKNKKNTKSASSIFNASGVSQLNNSSYFAKIKKQIKEEKEKKEMVTNFKATLPLIDFKKIREDMLIKSMNEKIENLQQVDREINNVLNNAYERIYVQAYMKQNDKMNKIIEHQKKMSFILNNNMINAKLRNTMVLDLINKNKK